MKVPPGIRSVTAITAAALALGLGVLTAAAPAQAQTARPANVAHALNPASSATTSVTVDNCGGEGDIRVSGDGGWGYPQTFITPSGVAACLVTPPVQFDSGGGLAVTFSNGLSGKLTMQGDGNFCWYVGTSAYTATWCSKTNGQPGDYADFQGDGNLVVYRDGVPKWASGTNGKGVYLALQADGNLVLWGITSSGVIAPVWAAF